MELKNKIVVVTGATGGIGEKLCKELDRESVVLVMIARTSEKLEVLQKELKNAKYIYPCDFTKSDHVKTLGKKLLNDLEKVDVLINAAGVGVYKSVEDVEYEEWNDSMAINVTAPYFLIKEILPLLKKSGEAVVLNLGSGMGKIPTACRSVYCATKYALRGMTLSLAEEFKGTHLHFIHIALGSTLTEFGPLTLKEKEEENLQGKAYFTPDWVAKRFIEIFKNNEFEHEIELYPSDYTGKEWNPS